MGEHGCIDLVVWQIRLFDHVYWFYIHVPVNGWFFWKSLACPAKDVVWKWKVLPATSHWWNCLSNDNVIRRFFEKQFPPSSLIPQISSCCFLIFPAEIAVVCNSANSLDLFSLPKKKTAKLLAISDFCISHLKVPDQQRTSEENLTLSLRVCGHQEDALFMQVRPFLVKSGT